MVIMKHHPLGTTVVALFGVGKTTHAEEGTK